MGETFAVDTKDFWAKVGALNFPAHFKNIGKTMKESGTLPLSLASFDGENPVCLQKLKKAVIALDFRVTDLAVTEAKYKDKYDEWLGDVGLDMLDRVQEALGAAGGFGHGSALTQGMKDGTELTDAEVSELLADQPKWEAFEKHAAARQYDQIKTILQSTDRWNKLLTRALVGFEKQDHVKVKGASKPTRDRYNGTMIEALRARGAHVQSILDKHFSSSSARWPPQVAHTFLKACTKVGVDVKAFTDGMEEAMSVILETTTVGLQQKPSRSI